MASKLFQFAVIMHPTEEEQKNGATSQLVVPVETILASDQNSAILMAGRKIPEDLMAKLERIEVVVRPF